MPNAGRSKRSPAATPSSTGMHSVIKKELVRNTSWPPGRSRRAASGTHRCGSAHRHAPYLKWRNRSWNPRRVSLPRYREAAESRGDIAFAGAWPWRSVPPNYRFRLLERRGGRAKPRYMRYRNRVRSHPCPQHRRAESRGPTPEHPRYPTSVSHAPSFPRQALRTLLPGRPRRHGCVAHDLVDLSFVIEEGHAVSFVKAGVARFERRRPRLCPSVSVGRAVATLGMPLADHSMRLPM